MGKLSTATIRVYVRVRAGFRRVFEQTRANREKNAAMTTARTMSDLTTAVERSFQEVLKELNDIQRRLKKLEAKADKAEGKLDRQEGKLDRLEGKADRCAEGWVKPVIKLESKLDKLEGKMDGWVGQFGKPIEKLESKLDKLEGKIEKLADEAERLKGGVIYAEAKLDKLLPVVGVDPGTVVVPPGTEPGVVVPGGTRPPTVRRP